MPLLWYILTDEQIELLKRFQLKHYKKKLNGPHQIEPIIKLETSFEDTDEVDKLMRQKPHYRPGAI